MDMTIRYHTNPLLVMKASIFVASLQAYGPSEASRWSSTWSQFTVLKSGQNR